MIELHHADCFDAMSDMADQSIPLVIADLPFGVTRHGWDRKLNLARFWEAMRRIVTPTGTVVMFATQPFASELIMSNPGWFRYDLVWAKTRTTGFQRCWQRPLSEHEIILIFSAGTAAPGSHNDARRMTYNPQGLVDLVKPHKRKAGYLSGYLGKVISRASVQTVANFPRSILRFASVPRPDHPTQKPVDLLRYLVRTYSNPGDTILDPTMGAGSTGLASSEEGRGFIGIERNAAFFDIAADRLGVEAIREAA